MVIRKTRYSTEFHTKKWAVFYQQAKIKVDSMEGFLLGLSNGTTCLAHCAPVVVPYFLREQNNIKKNVCSLLGFLSGRLIGYLLFAVVAWAFGNAISEFQLVRELLFGFIFLLLSLFMAYSGLFSSAQKCVIKPMQTIISRIPITNQLLITIALGLLTGINFCPPFLLAFSSSAYDGSLFYTFIFFFTFYLGTVLYFIPIVFLAGLNRRDNIQTIGKMMSVLMAIYFFFKGFFMIISCFV